MRKIPRTITRKWRAGMRFVSHCTASGIARIGKMNPESSMVGSCEASMPAVIAVCCVGETTEISSPMPSAATR